MCSFLSPKPPAPVAAPPTPAPAPQTSDPQVQQQQDEGRKRRLRAVQSNTTLVNGGQGLTDAATTGNKTLFGQ